MGRWKFLRLVVLGVLAFGTASQARALLMLQLSAGSTTASIADGGLGDANPAVGAVTFSGPLGVFIVNVTTGVSKPLVGGFGQAELDLNSIDVSGGAGTLTLRLTDTDFHSPIGTSSALTAIGGTTSGTVTLKSYIDLSNATFGTGTPVATLGSFGPGAFSAESGGSITTADPFSLTLVAAITHTASGQTTSFNANLYVPEPNSLAILGLALFALGLVHRLQRGTAPPRWGLRGRPKPRRDRIWPRSAADRQSCETG